MNIKFLALVRVWECCMSGRNRAEIERVGDDMSKMLAIVKDNKKVDKHLGETFGEYFVMPYDAAKHMVDTINDQYEYDLKVWRSEVYGEPMPVR